MTEHLLEAERRHLAGLLEAIQRGVYFLEACRGKLHWPIQSEELAKRCKDVELFEMLSAMNDRFGKSQDTQGAGRRHAFLLSGESGETFLKVLAFHEKMGVLNSVTDWQHGRATRNRAADACETDQAATAEHFNTLQFLLLFLFGTAARHGDYGHDALSVRPLSDKFSEDCKANTRQAEFFPTGSNLARES